MLKILEKRLKDHLENLVSSCQTSFVPDGQGLDNAVLCYELLHPLRYTKAKKGVAIMKLDLEKAYDRVE